VWGQVLADKKNYLMFKLSGDDESTPRTMPCGHGVRGRMEYSVRQYLNGFSDAIARRPPSKS